MTVALACIRSKLTVLGVRWEELYLAAEVRPDEVSENHGLICVL